MNSFIKGLAVFSLAMAVSGLALASDDWQGGDATKGAKVFKKCMACHTVEEGGPNRVGPNLWGIFGSGSTHNPDYNYSAGAKAKAAEGLVWSGETLFEYLEAPKKFVPGTTMSFAGLKKPEDRRDLIAYLEIATGAKQP
ncbi:MAG: c-type cytochrome [Rhizobiales bacterium]|nr:c-type cytochrome [Hyphomicrobiales bacterium]